MAEAINRRAAAHRLQDRPSLTAEAVTMARALEHLKPPEQRVVDDPWAHLFLSGASRTALRAWSGSLTGRTLRRLGRTTGTTWVPLRHRFIDDHLVAALDGGAHQVVLLGAGYDIRAYRFGDQLDGRRVFEVDLPAISRAKAATIAKHADELPSTEVVRVEMDFEQQSLAEVLLIAGLEPDAPTFITWEGVPMYLTAAVKATLDAVHDVVGVGSVIAHDMWTVVDDPGLLGSARRFAPTALSFIGEPVTFCIHPEEVGWFFQQRGFDVVDLATGDDLVQRYSPDDRALVDPMLYVLAAARA